MARRPGSPAGEVHEARVERELAVIVNLDHAALKERWRTILEVLSDLTANELRKEWRRLYRSQPPRLSRDLLVRAIAYRIQEFRYGGLSKATRRKLASLVEARDSGAEIAKEGAQRIRPGARLIREWNGRTHTVTVEEDGFSYAGQNYRSLSAVAREITGARWSGPRFFGLAVKRGISDA